MKLNKESIFYLINPNLDTDEKLRLINDVLEKLIFHFHNKATESKRKFELYKYGSILFAAITTIVASLQVIFSSSFPQWLLPVVSAAATVFVSFLGASGVQKTWINSRTTCQQLQTEQFLFSQNSGLYKNLTQENSIAIFSERLVELWTKGHERWAQTVGDD